MDISLRPFYSRSGGKFNVRKTINDLIPDHDIYIEPFFGGGAIFWHKKKAKINVINDLDTDMINRIKLILDAPSDLNLYRKDLTTLDKVKEFYSNSFKEEYSTADKILLEKIITGCGFSGCYVRMEKNIYKIEFGLKNNISKIDLYKQKLENVKIYNTDYMEMINKYDSENSFFFIDPPYECCAKRWGYAQPKDFDFILLRERLKKLKGKFLLTLNDSENIRNIFSEFDIIPFIAKSRRLNIEKTKQTTRNEVFIKNY
jgi:DNA adenine methylase